ncbi:hypothetical protein KDK_08050 [Dictyobacter kobayashii]|uniref:DUF218 domain-containing protein n=2 Tax=Dictyobacter kobayashii TaxID=2014872 RepID=A0A402AD37_9CHLR|nr:hypothetical protein KDK_08050 [Dictyobacter kobayashii]
MPFIAWTVLFLKGKQFALRDRLKNADAIVVLAGTRGKIKFLDGKIQTAAHLYCKGWAPYLIASGKFSFKITDTPSLIPIEDLEKAVKEGRIGQKDATVAAKSWDTGLGATYIRDQAIKLGVPGAAILMEAESLHTRENAEYVLEILKKHNMQRIILVTSPFHQLRTYLTFAKVFQPYNIEIINYYADSDEWSPATWFLNKEHRKLIKSERERIEKYRAKGDLL